MSTGAELHAACEDLAPLLGTWRGPGEGHYPTIPDFAYLEELTFGHVGKPFLAMTQRTRDPQSDAPLHTEATFDEQIREALEQRCAVMDGAAAVDDTSTADTADAQTVDASDAFNEACTQVKTLLRNLNQMECTTLSSPVLSFNQ